MIYAVRAAVVNDENFLWEMLYYAAHMDEEPGATVGTARTNPTLAPYVEQWKSRPGDLGFVALALDSSAAGAAWIRVIPSNPLHRFVPSGTAELAIATLPKHIGKGAGTLLLRKLLESARDQNHRTLVLSVRVGNPAQHLYERHGFRSITEIVNRAGTKSLVMTVGL
jgi:ribosomal protein S18 acetylase RimI-like enzyme